MQVKVSVEESLKEGGSSLRNLEKFQEHCCGRPCPKYLQMLGARGGWPAEASVSVRPEPWVCALARNLPESDDNLDSPGMDQITRLHL